MSTPNKRDTLFPGSSNVSSLGKRGPPDDDRTSRLSASQIPRVPDFLPSKRRAPPPAALPVKVNPNSQHFSTTGRFSRPKPLIPQGPVCSKSNPWEAYYAILKEGQSDRVTIAYKKELQHPIVAIKQRVHEGGDDLKKIIASCHENIVSLYEAHFHDGNLYFVYESMDVSLSEIQSTPYGTFAEFHIATLCKEILNGVQYVHRELSILHGSVNADSVMVDRTGCIKIANIGQSMLSDVASAGVEKQDLRDLGLLMIRLMELGTSLTNPKSLELQAPEKWKDQIKIFLRKTQECSGETLLQDVFLEQSPGSHCFKPLVLLTERSILRDWDYCMG